MFAKVCVQVGNFSIYYVCASTLEVKHLLNESKSSPILIYTTITISTIENH